MSTIEAAAPVSKATLDPMKEAVRSTRHPDTTVSGITDQNLDMVRNILFGEQVRENEKRQAALERFVRVSINAWSEDTQKKFDHLQRELQILKELLQDETKARREDTQAAKNRLDDLNRQTLELEKKQRLGQDEATKSLQVEVERVEQLVTHTRDQWQQQLTEAVQQLRQDKPDRKALAVMLQGVAKQLYDGVRE